ncbi:MAG: ribosome biogenesis GTPase Der [Paracoccaceae bacterium]
MSLSVALIGRPNVGKSTLFNRLVGKKLAIVDNEPGVTRDLREGNAKLADLRFKVIDTAGLEPIKDMSLQGRMRRLTEKAIANSDVCIFIIDARSGVIPNDSIFVDLLRKKSAKIILVANKAEGSASEDILFDAYSLGLGEPLRLSAEHGDGMSDLALALRPFCEEFNNTLYENDPETNVIIDNDTKVEHSTPPELKPLQIAVIGRPNAGKSTLINQILKEERMLTGPEAGITRDAISVLKNWNGTTFRIFDTAGIRKRPKVQEKLEKLSVSDALRAVKFAEVIILLLDAATSFEQQDLRIADLAEREGRAVVIAINKWDLEKKKSEKALILRERCARLLPQLRGLPLIFISSLNGRGFEKLQEATLTAHRVWNKRILTASLNRWLSGVIEQHPPPAPQGKRIKLRYITQVKARPPAFVIMCSYPDLLPESYSRYLVNSLRENFDLPGTPIRLFFRSQKEDNPFKNRKKKGPSKLRKHLK